MIAMAAAQLGYRCHVYAPEAQSIAAEVCGGFTEATHGNWYDDNIIEEGYAFLTGQKTRWVEGPAVHMYHLPGWTGDHLTDADRAATAMNRSLLRAMRRNIRLRAKGAVRHLMLHRAPGRGDDE